MASPPKPWERAGVNFQSSGTTPVNNMSGPPGGGPLPPCCTGGGASAAAMSSNPPPVPTRPSQQSTYGSRFSGMGYGGYSPYSSPYSSFGMGGYGGLGSYGGYSPYSMYGGYGSMGSYGNDYMGNSIARQAEESSRPAFQSIESIVQAFTSVSMMLDSTFQAVYNSFRAVIGVADNFTRLKVQLAQVFSAFAVIRFIRYLWRKLLVLLRLRNPGHEEEVWKQATDVLGQVANGGEEGPKKSTWPIMMFFAVILGGPWLIWKMISSLTDAPGKRWMTGEDDHFVAKANHDFSASGQEEVSFRAGQEIRVAPKELQPRMKGWLLGSVDGKKVGIIPANYVKVLGKKRGTRSQQNQQIQPGQVQPNQFQPSEPVGQIPTTVATLPSEPTKSVHFENGQPETLSGVKTSQESTKSCCGGKNKTDTCESNDVQDLVSSTALENEFQNMNRVDSAVSMDNKGPALMNAEDILEASKGEFDG